MEQKIELLKQKNLFFIPAFTSVFTIIMNVIAKKEWKLWLIGFMGMV